MANLSSSQSEPVSRLRLIVDGVVQTDTEFPLPPGVPTLLGRDPECDLVLEADANVSRRHAEIRPHAQGGWELVDLGSSNGTFVNGRRVEQPVILAPGDRIGLANPGVELQFESIALPEGKSAAARGPVIAPETINTSKYRAELSPRRLVVVRKATGTGCGTLFVLGMFAVFPPMLLLLAVGLALFALLMPHERRYTVDLDAGQLLVERQTWVEQLGGRWRRISYPLTDFTAVRLSRSAYAGDEGTHYDDYAIALDRAEGQPVKLALTWRDRGSRSGKAPAEAQELVDLLEAYLAQVD